MKWFELKIPPLLVTLIFGGAIWIIPNSFKVKNLMVLYAIASILFFIGSLVSILGVREFRRQKTTVNPMSPQESNSLVINGIYKFTRNPMYLGFLFWLLSLGVILGKPISLVWATGFVLYMNYFQIFPEERILTENFGEDYIKYKSSVRRWM
jgi:protein-S-isoprenylcysteine O-methyltransferase Ste14